jgi:hypothetical protein
LVQGVSLGTKDCGVHLTAEQHGRCVFSRPQASRFVAPFLHICLAFYPHVSAFCTIFFDSLRIYKNENGKVLVSKLKRFGTTGDYVTTLTLSVSYFGGFLREYG